jgi:hypothetical protein
MSEAGTYSVSSANTSLNGTAMLNDGLNIYYDFTGGRCHIESTETN